MTDQYTLEGHEATLDTLMRYAKQTRETIVAEGLWPKDLERWTE